MFATDEAFFGSSEPRVSQDLVKQPANSKKMQRRKNWVLRKISSLTE